MSSPGDLPLLQHFPPVTYGFAYGSGVFHQEGLYSAEEKRKGSGPMIDMVLVVDEPLAWHAEVGSGLAAWPCMRLPL